MIEAIVVCLAIIALPAIVAGAVISIQNSLLRQDLAVERDQVSKLQAAQTDRAVNRAAARTLILVGSDGSESTEPLEDEPLPAWKVPSAHDEGMKL